MLSLSFRYQSWDSNQKSIKLPDLPTKNYISSLIFLSSFFGVSSICIPAICIAVLEEPNSETQNLQIKNTKVPFGLLKHLPPFITHYFLKARRGSLKTMEIQFRVKWRKAG